MDDDTARKPAYDNRQHYHEMIHEYMRFEAQALMANNIPERLKWITQIYILTKPYISKDDRNEIDKSIGQADKYLGINAHPRMKEQMMMMASRFCDKAKSEIMLYAKHFFLPLGDDEDVEIDWEEIKRRGG